MSFRNEPILELRRAPAREALLEGLRGLDAKLPLSVPVLVGDGRGSAEGLDSTDPGQPTGLWPRRGGPTRSRRRRGRGGSAARLSRLERPPGGRPGRGAAGGRGPPARAPPRARRAPGARMRQALARGRRRRLRGDRLPRVLRGRRAGAGARPRPDPGPRRAQRDALRAARRDGGDRALELPAGDPVRHDRRGPGRRQRGDPQARRAVAGERRGARRGAARRRRAARRAVAAARLRRGRRGAGARPAGAHDRLHRLGRRRPRDPAGRAAETPEGQGPSSAWSPRWAARTA